MNSSLRGSETCWSSSLERKSSCSWGDGIMAGWEQKPRFNVSFAPSEDRDVHQIDLGLFSVRVGALRWHESKVLLHELQDQHRVYISLAPLATPEERGERTWCRSCLANRAARYGFESILQSTMSVSSICSRILSRCQHPVRRTVADNWRKRLTTMAISESPSPFCDRSLRSVTGKRVRTPHTLTREFFALSTDWQSR